MGKSIEYAWFQASAVNSMRNIPKERRSHLQNILRLAAASSGWMASKPKFRGLSLSSSSWNWLLLSSVRVMIYLAVPLSLSWWSDKRLGGWCQVHSLLCPAFTYINMFVTGDQVWPNMKPTFQNYSWSGMFQLLLLQVCQRVLTCCLILRCHWTRQGTRLSSAK